MLYFVPFLIFLLVIFLLCLTNAEAFWEYIILDPEPPGVGETASTGVGDLDGDGREEVVVGGVGAMLWYRPSTFEKGIVAKGRFHVGVAIADIDGDGRKEIIAGRLIEDREGEKWALCLFKLGKNLREPFKEYIIDLDVGGGPHDVLVADIDSDGQLEVIANAMYCLTPALYVYKPNKDITSPWKKQVIQQGLPIEGTSIGDIDGDGRIDIASGPYWFSPPQAGPFSGELWQEHRFAPHFRDMCRTALVDINDDGLLDIVIVESEYLDGRLSWFENRLRKAPQNSWVEHSIENNLVFAHSLQVWKDKKSKEVNLFVGEMNQGGWGAPYNYDARLIQYIFADNGRTVRRKILYKGEGTHEGMVADVDGDGAWEIVGHSSQVRYTEYPDCIGWVQLFKQRVGSPPFANWRHEFIDKEKPSTATDILWVDVDGDGLSDVVCGAWWYKNPNWERRQIPGVAQVLNAFDIDKDGRKEIICLKGNPGELNNELCWLKPIDPINFKWEEHKIGSGSGDWPHSTLIASLLPGGRIAIAVGYHNRAYPELFEAPDNLTSAWKRRVLAQIPYGEEMALCDLDGDGIMDIVAGPYWLENKGDGAFIPHLLVEGFNSVCRVAIADINGDKRLDIVVSEEKVDWNIKRSYFARVAWLENTGDPRKKKFIPHTIDRIICPHSLSLADLDGDGKLEIIAGEHDPFKPYQSRSRLFIYKMVEPKGRVWARYLLDQGFELHCGVKIVELAPGKFGILGHGWVENKYVHLWRP